MDNKEKDIKEIELENLTKEELAALKKYAEISETVLKQANEYEEKGKVK